MPTRIEADLALHAAQVALEIARALPGGQERFQALKEAGILRTRATNLVLDIERIERERLAAIKIALSEKAPRR